MKLIIFILLILVNLGCSSVKYFKTAESIDIQKFMGNWYVVAGRTSFFEKGAYNSLERYTWNSDKKRIDIDFSFNKNSFDGPLKKIPQKAWIENTKTNAHWKVQPIWPLKLDYLILAVGKNYEWSLVGVPNQAYVWIMTRDKNVSESYIDNLISKLKELDYSTSNIKIIEHD